MHIVNEMEGVGLEFGLQHQSFVDGWRVPMQNYPDE
jgi:hypothetical protein